MSYLKLFQYSFIHRVFILALFIAFNIQTISVSLVIVMNSRFSQAQSNYITEHTVYLKL